LLCAGLLSFVLYTDKARSGNPRSSDLVLVFDWEGNPVKIYRLNRDAYYIAVNPTKKMYCVVKDGDGAFNIVFYDFMSCKTTILAYIPMV